MDEPNSRFHGSEIVKSAVVFENISFREIHFREFQPI